MPTRVEPQATMYCTPGNVYSITNTKPSAQMGRISAATGVVTPVGAPATIATQFNGPGIGSGGDPIYAYDRYDANATGKPRMYIFNHATDTWTNTNRTYDTTLTANGAFNGSLVVGGVDLSTDRYYFGGFVSGGQTFKLWTYNHTTGVFAYKGSVATPGSGVNANGDLAFDSKGNLFILRNSGTESKIFSVTNEQVGRRQWRDHDWQPRPSRSRRRRPSTVSRSTPTAGAYLGAGARRVFPTACPASAMNSSSPISWDRPPTSPRAVRRRPSYALRRTCRTGRVRAISSTSPSLSAGRTRWAPPRHRNDERRPGSTGRPDGRRCRGAQITFSRDWGERHGHEASTRRPTFARSTDSH